MDSIEQKLARAFNRPSGFDYMRLVLSTGVIAQHTLNVVYGERAAVSLLRSPAGIPFVMILPMFFALSGFLVAGSLERNRSLISFIGLRAIRLLPALSFETTLSALVLGPLFTTVSLKAYFSDPEFSAYFLNIIGWIHYTLPGVFLVNPTPDTVNVQLWTIPVELKCYVALAILAFVGAIGRRSVTAWIVVAMQLFLVLLLIRRPSPDHPALAPSLVLIGCFLAGVCLYRLRASIPLTLPLGATAIALCVGLLVIPRGYWLLPLPAAYATVFLGALNPRRNRILLSGDYSYGLFLYGFPIQQAVAAQSWCHDWQTNLAVAYPIAFLLAFVSWWLVERPAMRLKSLIHRVETLALGFRPLEWHRRHVFAMVAPPAEAVER